MDWILENFKKTYKDDKTNNKEKNYNKEREL